MKQFVTKDSGKRRIHESGMQRDTNDGKARFDLIIPLLEKYNETLLYRWAMLMTRGAQKYNERNWEKADSIEELNRAKESAFRHFIQWFCNEEDEDHAVAVLFNINEVEYIKNKLGKKDGK
jgi:hypothetical protein